MFSGVNTFIVLICGLNIRAQNRLSLTEQLRLLRDEPDLTSVHHKGDKGSYCVTTAQDAAQTVRIILTVLRKRCPSISSAALSHPTVIGRALEALEKKLAERYGDNFDLQDFGLTIEGEHWRAGLAVPVYPATLPPTELPFYKTKNALILGASNGAALVAKREAPNVHWGTAVTDPCERLIKRITGCTLKLTSRSANIMRELLTVGGA